MNLIGYILKRLASVLPLLIFLPLLTFLLMHLVPGNYFDSLRMNPQISRDTLERYEQMYHLDQPVLMQYLYWLSNLLRLDFGYSFAYNQPVLKLLASRFANTLLLTGTSFLLAWFLAAVLGLWAGMRRDRWPDRVLSLTAYVGLSIPNFFLCLLLLWQAASWGALPLGGVKSVGFDALRWWEKIGDVARHMVIPVSVLTLGSFAYLFRLMRAQTIEVADREFVFYLRTLRLPEHRILFKHIARNALNPMVTLFGMELPALFSGAALVEIFTGWPGLGQMMLQAVRTQDIFLVLGNMLMIAFLLVLGNLLADILLVTVDPRIRLGGQST